MTSTVPAPLQAAGGLQNREPYVTAPRPPGHHPGLAPTGDATTALAETQSTLPISTTEVAPWQGEMRRPPLPLDKCEKRLHLTYQRIETRRVS